MGLALNFFSREVCALGKCKEILWIFSGTRPNLYLEFRIASKFGNIYDVSKVLADFDAENVVTVFGEYFDVKEMSSDLKKKIEHIAGPPKLLYWFILSTMKTNPLSISIFEKQWCKIEDVAIGMYQEQIQGTIKSFGFLPEKLENYSRNLCLLHTILFFDNRDGFLSFEELPPNWLPFIEAGMIRVRKEGTSWRLFPPNRFLVKIFNKYIKWFNWENIQDLLCNIKASEATKTLKGKVFEYLFALELLAPSDSSIWKRLGEDMNIRPKLDWKPKIELIGNINSQLDQNCVYIMIDPAHDTSKTDVVFFASNRTSNTPVRVLCQLTTQVKESTIKAKRSFSAMFELEDDHIPDYRLYLAPKSTVDLPPIHQQKYSDTNCFWIDSTSFNTLLQFSLDFCDPTKTTEAFSELMDFARSQNDRELCAKIGLFVPETTKKRKREFDTIDQFYNALKQIEDWEEEDTEIVKKIFKAERIKNSQLSFLTDEKLEKYGLMQGGLREAVLYVIENQLL